jgi:hypothetical protein
MSKTRVYFDPNVQPIVDRILSETGIRTYTDVVNWMIRKYSDDFIVSYKRFLAESIEPKTQD